MTIIQRLLGKFLRIQTAHPRLALLAAGLLALLSIVYTIRNLEFQTGQLDLISPENRLVRLSEKIDSFDKLDRFVVVIENRDSDRSLQFLKSLVQRLQNDRGKYAQIFYRVDPNRFKQWELQYLSKKELLDLQKNLYKHRQIMDNIARDPSLDRLFAEINREMASSMVGELFTGFLDEDETDATQSPLDLTFLIRLLDQMKNRLEGKAAFISPWGSFFSNTDGIDTSGEGYFWTEKDRYLLLFVTPRQGGDSFSGALDSLSALRGAIARTQQEFRDIEAGVTGLKALNADEMGTALHDMTIATFISLGALTILLALFWRGFKRPVMEMIELILALSWTFGLTTLFIGHLNILSVTFAPLLLGLGIDYGIHWLARYQEEIRTEGMTKIKAMETVMTQLGPGVILAGLTAALSFFPLVLTGFKGLQELGLITAMGMIMTTITTLGILPSLIMVWDKPLAVTGAAPSPEPPGYLLRLTRGRALAVLIPGLAALGVSVWAASGVSFDLNMLHLQSRHAESVVWEKKLIDNSDMSSMYGAVLAHSPAEVREKTAVLETLPTVSEVQSVETLLPKDRTEKIVLLQEMKPLLAGLPPVKPPGTPVDTGKLKTILARIRFKMLDSAARDWGADRPLESQMVRVRGLIDQLTQRFQTMDRTRMQEALEGFQSELIKDLGRKLDLLRDNVEAGPMQISDLPQILRERFVQNGLYLIRVLPKENIWEPRYLGKFVKELLSVEPDAIGDPVTLYVFTKAFRDASIKAAIYAVAFIVVLLMVTFRKRLIDVLWVMLPLLVGTAWTLGLMRLFGVDLNLANSIFLPLVVGAGVEYGIIFMQRFRQEEQKAGADVRLPFSTTKGIILAGLTTTVGFGSLTISSHQGIHSLGLLATVGSLSILTAAVLFLPSCLRVAAKGESSAISGQKPEKSEDKKMGR